MHSRIFQVSKNKITEDNRIEEYRYDDGFVGRVADYVVKQDDIKSDLEWLTTCHKGIEVTRNGKTVKLTIVSREEYFEKSFEEFKEGLQKLSEYTMADFIDSKNWLDFWKLKDSYDNEHGFYVDDNDEYFGITTFDNFMRNAEDGDVYYIGNVFDYHS